MLKNVSTPQIAAAWRVVVVGLVVLLFAPPAQSQDRARYRDYRLGNDLTSVAALAKVPAAGAKTVHQRPGLIQELEWRQPYMMIGSTKPQTDPVQRIVFSFYDDQLFRMAINYDRRRTNGLTDADMIEALSATYGPALLLTSTKNLQAPAERPFSELGAPIAQWGDLDYSVGLYRSPFATEFSVVVTSPRLEALAQTSTAEAIRLDEREAPQIEAERKKKEADDIRASQEKARLANKAVFTP
jgi:hypothetical protein